jgi:hypothetical protein
MGDDPAAGTVVPSGQEAMRTAWSRNLVSVSHLSCQTTLIGHNGTLPEPCPGQAPETHAWGTPRGRGIVNSCGWQVLA